jgi:hypothetical protein
MGPCISGFISDEIHNICPAHESTLIPTARLNSWIDRLEERVSASY